MRTDEELLEAMQRGEEEALVELYRRHQARLHRFAMQMTGSREVADESVQDTFLMLIRKPDTWKAERGTVRAFLYGLTRNIALQHAEDHTEFGDLDFDVEAAADLLSDLDREERVRSVRDGILSLPAGYREAVVLCDMEELNYEDAAAIVGCPVGTIRSRVSRGRAMLAAKLKTKFAGRIA